MSFQLIGRRRPLAVLALAMLSLASIGAGVGSLAIWTDSATSDGTFTAGTIDLTTSPSTLFTATGAVPGDSGSASLTVANAGAASLRYAMTSSSTNADGLGLRSQLQLTISSGACPGGSTLYATGAIASAAFGDPSQGSQSGDRTLAAGASEQLCFAWSLPASTGNAYQGATTTTTFTFAAEQTSSNP